MSTAVARPLASRLTEIYTRDDLHHKMEAYRRAKSDRERRELIDGVYILRRRAESSVPTIVDETIHSGPIDRSEQWPCHQGRDYSTEPDSDGWRLVVKKLRVRRHLTDTELEAKYADAWKVGDVDEDELNDELVEGSYRRRFY